MLVFFSASATGEHVDEVVRFVDQDSCMRAVRQYWRTPPCLLITGVGDQCRATLQEHLSRMDGVERIEPRQFGCGAW